MAFRLCTDWTVLLADPSLKPAAVPADLFITLLVMNGIGATQDIATDGLAVNILKMNSNTGVIPFR